MGSEKNGIEKRPRGPWKRVLKWVLVAVAALILLPLAIVVVVAFTVDLGGIVRGQIETLRPGWEEQLGRKIAVGDISVRLLPRVMVEVKKVVVAAAPNQVGDAAEPLAQVSAVRVGVAVWPLVRSFGKDVQVSRIEVDAPRLTVVRFAGGRLSYQDILDRLTSTEKPPSKPLTPEQLAYLRRIEIGRAAIENADLRFHDLERGDAGLVEIKKLDVVAENIRLADPITVSVDAAVHAEEHNFHLLVSVGPLPSDLDIEQPIALLRRLDIKLQPLEIAPFLRFLPPPSGLGVSRALVDADLQIEMPAHAAKLRIVGTVGAVALVLSREHEGHVPPDIERGAPVNLRLKIDVLADPLAGDVSAQLIDVALNDMGISGKADLRSLWTSPAVHSLDFASHGLTLEGLLAMLPPSELPRNATLVGPLSFKASASGAPTNAKVDLTLDLNGATLLVPALHKPAGVLCNLGFLGTVQPSGIDIERLGLVLGPLSLLLHGHVKSAENLDLDLDSGKVSLDPLLRLLPTVAKSVPAGQKLAGELQISGQAKRRGDELHATAHVALRDADARAPSLELHGGADLSALVSASKGAATVDADLDLTAAHIVLQGSMDKAIGVPMRLKLNAGKSGTKAAIKEAKLTLPGGVVEMMGQADFAAHRLDARVPLVDLDLAQLARVLPLLKTSLPPAFSDGKLKFSLAVDGDPEKPESLHGKLEQFDLVASGTHLVGQADLVGLAPPKKASFKLHADTLDLDRFVGGSPAKAAQGNKPASTKQGEPAVPTLLKTLVADGTIDVGSGMYKGVRFKDLVAELTLAAGKATFKVLKMSTFGGTVSATGSTVDFNPAEPKFGIRAKLSQIQLGQVLAVKSASLGEKLTGRGNFDLDCDGTGLSWEQIAPKLAGQLAVDLADGTLNTPSIAGLAIGDVLTKMPGFAGSQAVVKQGMGLKDLSTTFTITDGQLRTNKPIVLSSTEGAVQLTGAIGLDETLALGGNMEISPEAIALVSGGRLKTTGRIPLQLKVGGLLSSPTVQIVDLQKTVAVVASQLLAGKGQELLKGALGGQLGGAAGAAAGQVLSGDTDQLKQKAAGEAQKRLQQGEEEARKRLEDEAKKNLGNGLKGIFGQ